MITWTCPHSRQKIWLPTVDWNKYSKNNKKNEQ